MPIYDYECRYCNNILEDEFVHIKCTEVICKKCGAFMVRRFPTNVNVHVFPNGGVHLENVSPEGKTFYSKCEMKKYAKEHNLELGALL